MSRESAFLPTIKCSSCGNQVEISMMGEHICVPASAELSPPPEADEQFEPYVKLAQKDRHVPAPVNTIAANGSYMNQGQPTPSSIKSDAYNASPLSPNARLAPNRADEYIPPSSTYGDSLAPSPRLIPRSAASSNFSDEAYSASPRYAPESPNPLTSSGFFEKMNTMAPGPFDTNRRPSTASNTFPIRKGSRGPEGGFLGEPSRDPYSLERPGTAHSHTSHGSYSAVPKKPKKNGYEGFGPPERTSSDLEPPPLGLVSRSETFPRVSAAAELPPRAPSASGIRPEHQRIPSVLSVPRRPSMVPDTSRPPPPRTSLVRARVSYKNSVDLAKEFGVNNPYHTPSDSGSSEFSTFSRRSQTSSQTSPARSQSRRQPSDTTNIDELMNDLQASMENLQPKDSRSDTPTMAPPRARSPLAEPPAQRSQAEYEEREDPAIQSARREDRAPRGSQQSPQQPKPEPPSQDRSFFDPAVQDPAIQKYTPQDPAIQNGRKDEHLMRVPPPFRKGSRDPNAPSRGDCKACGLAITGKSISSADGRLTGKYHKSCFVCATCSRPFSSGEFYVFDDKPYCEQHYHHLNGSLCGSCGRGIEGQYLEDEAEVKYHTGCFCCLDCGRSLSDGYFEVEGKSYCERDAWRRIQQPWFAGNNGPPQDPYKQMQGPPPRGPPGPYGPPGPRPPKGMMGGLPGRPGQRPGPPGMGFPPRPRYGPPNGNRFAPGPGPGPGPGQGLAPRPLMNKRATRLGMM